MTDIQSIGPQQLQSDKAADAARSFEGVFLGQLFKAMFETVESGDFSGGNGEEMFRGILAENLGSAVASKGGVGLTPAVLDVMIRLQGASKP